MRKKFLKILDFLHNCGKLLWRTCLFVVGSEVLIEVVRFFKMLLQEYKGG